MSWKAKTVVFIIAAVLVIAGYDILAIWKGGYDATISWTLYSASHKNPIIAVVFGVLLGHLFWGQ